MKGEPQPANTADIRVSITRIQPTKKSLVEAYILAVTLGILGAHHFYLRRPWFGIAYLFTFGLFGIGYVVDLCRMPCLVAAANRKIRDPEKESEKDLVDAYLLWFPCGILGFHLFYLNKPGQGVFYFCTLGCCGVGWLIDMCRIPFLLKEANENPPGYKPKKSLCVAYLLGLSPFGLIGAHHFYLERPLYGLTYTWTFGLLGVGYVADWFRMPFLVERANKIADRQEDPDRKFVDDVYILWFPFGILGFHHFYLRRFVWGFLYMCTFGLFGVGWIIDGCRLPCLVKDFNEAAEERKRLLAQAQSQMPGCGSQVVNVVVTGGRGDIMAYPRQSFAAGCGYQNPGYYPPTYMQYPQQGQGQGQGQLQGHPQPGLYPTAALEGSVPAAFDSARIAPPSYEESVSVKPSLPPS
ncbi:uncharacterized protein LOC121373253 [Gigantopelta aegis]|uniref:uncharacterized protein LOC121373253 n=1 Tax=Gigantopelta aegis TaxID=1735272 RepID=UPI001B88CED9|nr:uncharacterized protein LOC121373253 [Gigantopelta aegis]